MHRCGFWVEDPCRRLLTLPPFSLLSPTSLHQPPIHNPQLPSVAEAALGAVLYEKFLAEQAAKRTLLDKTHPDTLLVSGAALNEISSYITPPLAAAAFSTAQL